MIPEGLPKDDKVLLQLGLLEEEFSLEPPIDESKAQFLSERWLYRQECDANTIRGRRKGMFDRGPFRDGSESRLWKWREYWGDYPGDTATSVEKMHDQHLVSPASTVRAIRGAYVVRQYGDDHYDVCTLDGVCQRNGVADLMPEFIEEKDLTGVWVPDDEYAWARKRNIDPEDVKIMEYAYQADGFVVTTDKHLGMMGQQLDRYEDVPVLPPDRAALKLERHASEYVDSLEV